MAREANQQKVIQSLWDPAFSVEELRGKFLEKSSSERAAYQLYICHPLIYPALQALIMGSWPTSMEPSCFTTESSSGCPTAYAIDIQGCGNPEAIFLSVHRTTSRAYTPPPPPPPPQCQDDVIFSKISWRRPLSANELFIFLDSTDAVSPPYPYFDGWRANRRITAWAVRSASDNII